MAINLSDYYPVSPDLSNVVLTTGNQAIGGIKNFITPPLVNNTEVVLTTGSQSITGLKTFNERINVAEIRGIGFAGSLRKIDPSSGHLYSNTAISLDYFRRILSGNWQFENRPFVNGTGVLLQGEVVSNSLDPFSGNRPITRVPVIGQNYGGDTISGFLNNMFFPFISATLTLNSFPIQEYGTNVTAISFNYTLDPKSEPVNTITNLQYFRNEIAITSPTTVVTGTVTSLPITLGVTANQNFAGLNVRVNVNDNGNPKTISGVNTLFFQPRYYYGMTGLASLNATQIRSLINSSPTFRPTDPRFTFSPNGQYIYFIYPNETKEGVTAWGNLTSIFDFGSNTENINNFITAPDIPDVTITGVNGKTMTYKVYRSSSLLTVQPGQQFDLRFRF